MKMNGVLNQFRPELELVLATIPRDHIISKEEILALTPEQIRAIQIVLHFTFGEEMDLNDYACLSESLVACTGGILANLVDNSVVLCPGDSPYKVVMIMKFLYFNPAINQWEYQTPTGIVRKNITFVTWPLSGAANWPLEELAMYMDQILEDILIAPDRVSVLDYVDSGSTIEGLNQVLRQRWNQPEFELPVIYMDALCFDTNTSTCPFSSMQSLLLGVFADAESDDCRCVPGYSYRDRLVSSSPTPINVQRCNLVLIAFYLTAIGQMPPVPMLPARENNFPSILLHYYTATYYDTESGEIKIDLVRASLTGNSYFIVRPGATQFPSLQSKLILFLSPTETNFATTRWIPTPDTLDKIGIVTLFNGQKIVSIHDRYGGLIAPPKTWINPTPYPSGYAYPQNAADFTPL